MTFKEAMEHYRDGNATEEERLLVEAELEKTRLISEYLDSQWEEEPLVPAAPPEEMQQVRKSLRRWNTRQVLTSLVLTAALLLGIFFVGIPAAESFFWDPTVASYGEYYSTDLEIMLAAYTELVCPSVNILGVNATKTGFASYDISISYMDAHKGGNYYATGSIVRSELTVAPGVLQTCAANIFDRATYPFYSLDEESKQNTYERLSALPEYITVLAAVSFPEDKSMAEVLEFQDSLIDGSVGWTAIRATCLDTQMYPLCGMNLSPFGAVRANANESYPCLDMKAEESTAENWETHFKSLLQFCIDQRDAGTGIDLRYPYRDTNYPFDIGTQGKENCYYTNVLEYVEENGIYSYGCYVVATPETFLELLDSGAVTQVWIQDVWIGG